MDFREIRLGAQIRPYTTIFDRISIERFYRGRCSDPRVPVDSDVHLYYLELGSDNVLRLDLSDGPVDWSILSETGWKLTHPTLNDRLNEYLEDLRLNGKAAERGTPPFYVPRPIPAERVAQE